MAGGVLGGFEHRVLLAIARLEGRSYSVPIVLELEAHTGRAVSPSKVYVTLRRLEERGLVESHFEPPPGSEGGPDRRVFTLLPEGLTALRESKRVFSSLWDGLVVLDGE